MRTEEKVNGNWKLLEESLTADEKLKTGLRIDLSIAIADVLKKHRIGGEYMFNISMNEDYGLKPITSIDGKEIQIPASCLGSGYSSVESPLRIRSLWQRVYILLMTMSYSIKRNLF